MISEVVMPQMGADMTEGTLLRWLKQEGDAVARGDVIAEIETDKANVEIEAFEAGVFRKTLAAEGDVIPIGGIIAIVAGADDDISAYTSGTATAAPAAATTRPAAAAAMAAAPTAAREPQKAMAGTSQPANGAHGRVRISPVARRIADERGIDIGTIQGTGPDGRIIRRDVEAYAAAPRTGAASAGRALQAATPAPAASKMRQAIARRMSQSKREAPHYYLLIDIDMTDAAAFRKQANDVFPEDERVSINDLIVKAAALALQKHPMFNATIAGGDAQPELHAEQNICIGIALESGLIAPALLDAGGKPLPQLAREARDLAGRAKGGALRPDEMSAGTFTISNLGAYGVETLIAIIQPPQTAILGVGAVTAQPAVHDGAVTIRQMMKAALSADHRITDGAQGAQFLAEIKRVLEHPLLLVL
jgi:pyruvate dehydrogenase E2 component (dihydrolipoamide acetyltransferase)